MNNKEDLVRRAKMRHAMQLCDLTSEDLARLRSLDFAASVTVFEDVLACVYAASLSSLKDETVALTMVRQWLDELGGEAIFWVKDAGGLAGPTDVFVNALQKLVSVTNANCLFSTLDGAKGISFLKREHEFAVRTW